MFHVFTKSYGIVHIEADKFDYNGGSSWYFYQGDSNVAVAMFDYSEVKMFLSESDYQSNTKLRKDKADASSKLLTSVVDELLRTVDGNNRAKLCSNSSHCAKSSCGCHIGCEYDSAAYQGGDNPKKPREA